jgi:hypothetical protein
MFSNRRPSITFFFTLVFAIASMGVFLSGFAVHDILSRKGQLDLPPFVKRLNSMQSVHSHPRDRSFPTFIDRLPRNSLSSSTQWSSTSKRTVLPLKNARHSRLLPIDSSPARSSETLPAEAAVGESATTSEEAQAIDDVDDSTEYRWLGGFHPRSAAFCSRRRCGYRFAVKPGQSGKKFLPDHFGQNSNLVCPKVRGCRGVASVDVLHPGVFVHGDKLLYANHPDPPSAVCRHNPNNINPAFLFSKDNNGPRPVASGAAAHTCNFGRVNDAADRIFSPNSRKSLLSSPSSLSTSSSSSSPSSPSLGSASLLRDLGVPRVAEHAIRYPHPPGTVVPLRTFQGIEAYRCLRRRLRRNTWIVFVGDSNTRQLMHKFTHLVFPEKERVKMTGSSTASFIESNVPWPADGKPRFQKTKRVKGREAAWIDKDEIGTFGREIDAETDADRPGLRISFRFVPTDPEKYRRIFEGPGGLSTVYGINLGGTDRAYDFTRPSPTGNRWSGEKSMKQQRVPQEPTAAAGLPPETFTGSDLKGDTRIDNMDTLGARSSTDGASPDLVTINFGMWGWHQMSQRSHPDWVQEYANLTRKRLRILAGAYKGPVIWRTLHAPRKTTSVRGRQSISLPRVLHLNAMHTQLVRDHYMILDNFKAGLDRFDELGDEVHFNANVYTAMAQQLLGLICG